MTGLLTRLSSKNTKTFSSGWESGEPSSIPVFMGMVYVNIEPVHESQTLSQSSNENWTARGLDTDVCCFLDYSFDADGSL